MSKSFTGNENIKTKSRLLKFSDVLSIIISIIVAIALFFCEKNFDSKWSYELEIEKARGVKEDTAIIIEDYIISGKLIDLKFFERLIEAKKSQTNINYKISTLETFQLAELNIMSSNYLDLNTKEKYKKVFDLIYLNLQKGNKINYLDYSNSNHKDLINDLLNDINSSNKEGSKEKLKILITTYSEDIFNLEGKIDRLKNPNILKVMIKNPFSTAGVFLVILLIINRVSYIYKERDRRLLLELYSNSSAKNGIR